MKAAVEDDVDVDAADGRSLLHLQQQLELLAELVLSLRVLRSDELYTHFVGRLLGGRDALNDFHEVSGLMELPDVRINYRDLCGSTQVRGEEGVERDSTLVLLELPVTLEQQFLGDRLHRSRLTAFSSSHDTGHSRSARYVLCLSSTACARQVCETA